jgi:hypothetical protein
MDTMTTTRVWRDMLYELKQAGDPVSPASPGADWKGRTTSELTAYKTIIPMWAPVIVSEARKPGYKFMTAEAAWILSGDNRVETIAPFSKMIPRFSDDGVRFFGAYGPPFVDQMSYVVSTLKADPFSRQAVIRIWRDQPRNTKDVPCTLTWQYLIRGGALQMVATMRSSDAITGWPYDVFTFSMTAAAIAIELRAWAVGILTGKDIGVAKPDLAAIRDMANLRLGSLSLVAGSQHYYLKDEDVVSAILAEEPTFRDGPYDPLDLAQFNATSDLTSHLWRLARGEALENYWLMEMRTGKL